MPPFGLFFLLQCCAHHDDGDSLGNDDDLVRPKCKKEGNTSQPTKQHQQQNRPTKTDNQKPNKPTKTLVVPL